MDDCVMLHDQCTDLHQSSAPSHGSFAGIWTHTPRQSLLICQMSDPAIAHMIMLEMLVAWSGGDCTEAVGLHLAPESVRTCHEAKWMLV